jgi:putative intracellular protease/amidase
MMHTLKILILLTSHDVMGDTGKKTGLWLEELAVPYNVFKAAGAEITLASPKGGKAPVDPGSEKELTAEVKAFLADADAMAKLSHTRKVGELTEKYDALFVAGGHGTMWDLPRDPEVARLVSRLWAQGSVVAAVCHGPAALVQAKAADGQPLVKGKKVAAFSDEEEQAAQLSGVVPFLLESKLTGLGAVYSKAAKWQPHVERDGKLVTGQNPASSRPVAEQVLAALR